MEIDQLEEMGPIDYVVLEWPNDDPATGEIQKISPPSGTRESSPTRRSPRRRPESCQVNHAAWR